MNQEPGLNPSDSLELTRRQQLLAEAIRKEESQVKKGIQLYLYKLKAVRYASELHEKIEEVFQSATTQAWRKARDFDPNYPAEKWLLTFAIHIIRNLKRAERRRTERVIAISDTDQAKKARSRSGGKELNEDEFYDLLYRPQKHAGPSLEELFSTLKEEEQQVLKLRFIEGLEGAELAAILGISIGAAYTRLCRAKNHLRQELILQQEQRT